MEPLLLLSGGLDPFSPYMLIIEASVIIVLSHLYGKLAEKTNIPSVLLLILTGILIKLGLEYLHIGQVDLMPVLEILGIVGLIMIVLEAALDLKLTKEKLPLIGRSVLIALLCLIGSVFALAGILQYFIQMNFAQALLYATPLSIMSSAIIIPSVNKLTASKREFMIYESTFSDILGIMLFYFIISFIESGGSEASVQFASSFILTLLVAVVASYVLIFLFKDVKGHTRLFLLIAILLILYAAGKLFHLSPLLIILVFGLALSNHHRFFKIFKNELSDEDPIAEIEKEFHLITLETAFLVRTFFFVIFGMTIALSSLVNVDVFIISALVLVALYAVRFIALKLFLKEGILPELYIAPRGLITILLFFAIPASLEVESFDPGILLYVILISSVIMTVSLIKDHKRQKAAVETHPQN
ncbi:MAG: cation:proton antiporter [Bacteroidota bacterium]